MRVTLLNEGPDAYRREEYGKKITVERKIPRTGAATYTILDEHDRKVSDQKRELENILKQFSIYCENPCCVLTQELSKRFIQGTGRDKYDFFLKATGLEMTSHEIKRIKDLINETNAFLEGARGKLRGKKDRMQKADEEVRKYKQFDALEGKITECVVKQFWVHYQKNVDICDSLKKEVERKRKDLEKWQSELEDVHKQMIGMENFEEVEKEINELNEKHKQASDEVTRRVQEYKEKSKNLLHLQDDIKSMEKQREENAKRLKIVNKDIKEKRQAALQAAQENEKSFYDNIENCAQLVEQLTIRKDNVHNSSNDAKAARDDLLREREQTNRHIGDCNVKIRKTREDIDRLSASQDRSAALNARMPIIRERVAATNFRDDVTGPLGLHIKLREGMGMYSLPVEKFVQGDMTLFIVHNRDDQNALSEIIKRSGASNVRIKLVKNKSRIPDNEIKKIDGGLSILDALSIENDIVFNHFVDRNADEILLSPSEEDVQRNFVVIENGREKLRNGITKAYLQNGVEISYRKGNKGRDANRYRLRNLLSEDMGAIINGLNSELDQHHDRLRELKRKQEEVTAKIEEYNQEIRSLDAQYRDVQNEIRNKQREKSDLENNLSEIREAGQVDTSALEEEKMELGQALDLYKTRIEEKEADHRREKGEENSLLRRKNEAQKVADDIYCQLQRVSDKLESFIQQKSVLDRNTEKANSKVHIAEKEVMGAEVILEQHRTKLAYLRADAQEKTSDLLREKWDGEDVNLEARDTHESLKKRIECYEKEVEEGRKKLGLDRRSRQQAVCNFENAVKDYEKSSQAIECLIGRKDQLSADLKERKKTWKRQLNNSSKKVMNKFDEYLQKKGQNGTVEFDHEENDLKMICQTDNFDEHTKCEDVKQLSGGERSFATLCLLLALGHVIDTPFRILDEYDVFMDENVRSITLMQIRDHGLDAAHRQVS